MTKEEKINLLREQREQERLTKNAKLVKDKLTKSCRYFYGKLRHNQIVGVHLFSSVSKKIQWAVVRQMADGCLWAFGHNFKLKIVDDVCDSSDFVYFNVNGKFKWTGEVYMNQIKSIDITTISSEDLGKFTKMSKSNLYKLLNEQTDDDFEVQKIFIVKAALILKSQLQ